MGRSLGNAGTFSLCYSSPKVLFRLASIEPAVGSKVFVNDTSGAANANGSGGTATAGIYEKILVGGGIDEITGEAVNVAIVNLTSGA
jgi:hypothetical protein